MKYKSSFNKEIKITILLLSLFWVVNFLAIINSNGIKDVLAFSVFMLIFAVTYISFLVKGIYIVVENNSVKYIHMFFLRREVEITKINKIQTGTMGGFYKSLSLIYEGNGEVNDIKIGTLTFKKDTLKQFVMDLTKQNPQIDLDESAMEIIS